MKKDIRDEWVKALRSGEYKQGKHALKTKDGDGACFCCLGVLAVIAKPELEKVGLIVDEQPDGIRVYEEGDGYGSYHMLPDSAIEALDFTGDTLSTLVDMNDGRSTFDEIADVIEKHL